MEPLTILSFFFNIVTLDEPKNNNFSNVQYYNSVYEAKQEIFNGSVKNFELNNITDLQLALNK